LIKNVVWLELLPYFLFYSSRSVGYTVKVVVFQKWCKIETLLLRTTNGK